VAGRVSGSARNADNDKGQERELPGIGKADIFYELRGAIVRISSWVETTCAGQILADMRAEEVAQMDASDASGG